MKATANESTATKSTALDDPIVAEIRRLHDEIYSAWRETWKQTLHGAIRVGELLTEKRASLGHGNWGPWLEQNRDRLGFCDRTATNYMRLYRNRAKIKTATVADLGAAYGLLGMKKSTHAKRKEAIKQQSKGKAGASAKPVPVFTCEFTRKRHREVTNWVAKMAEDEGRTNEDIVFDAIRYYKEFKHGNGADDRQPSAA